MRYTWLWRKICDKEIAVNDFGERDFVTRMRIDVRISRFLIGNLNDVKLIAQSVINEWQRRNQASKKASELARKQKLKMTIKLKTGVWDAAENLDTVEDIAAYFEAALEDGDASPTGLR
jgi:hypothetical protein